MLIDAFKSPYEEMPVKPDAFVHMDIFGAIKN